MLIQEELREQNDDVEQKIHEHTLSFSDATDKIKQELTDEKILKNFRPTVFDNP